MISAGSELELLRSAFRGVASVREVKMFGGTAFMVNGHITVAASPRGLLVRTGPEAHQAALRKAGARAMQMRGRVMIGYVYVDPFPSEVGALHSWVQIALHHNRTLPARKPAGAALKKRKSKPRSDRP